MSIPTPPGARSFFRPHQYLAREGERAAMIHHVQEGWACRYRLLPDGRRQVTGLFLPGDWCELSWAQGQPATQPVVALTNIRALSLGREDVRRAIDRSEALRTLLLGELIAGGQQQAEWIINLGRKTAMERLAYLFCELFHRLRGSGLTYGDQFAMPLTQIDLADVTGLTPVHVNRTLQKMRARGLVELRSRWLRIPDLAELGRIALFPASVAAARRADLTAAQLWTGDASAAA